ncbi:MAG: tRNA-binding protein [Saprospirales bacterium]|nr:MAG: tRNA-binding protein [Saprospirales bacterium]
MEKKPMISWSDFDKVDMRVGKVLEASYFEEAKVPAIKMLIDFGPIGTLKSSAQITDHYLPANLVGNQVIAVVNFPPKQVANMMSECLVLGIIELGGEVVLLRPDKEVENGRPVA